MKYFQRSGHLFYRRDGMLEYYSLIQDGGIPRWMPSYLDPEQEAIQLRPSCLLEITLVLPGAV